MFTFLLVLQALIALSLVTVILLQRSEGGGLGVGGSSAGFMTARGAADFLTRATAVLAALFILNSITLAAIAGASAESPAIDTSLVGTQGQAPASVPAPSPTTTPSTTPAPSPSVPLAQ